MKELLKISVCLFMLIGFASCSQHGTCPAYQSYNEDSFGTDFDVDSNIAKLNELNKTEKSN